MRSELLELTEELAETRGLLLMQKRILENIIAGLAAENPRKRLSKQEFFMRYSQTNNERIAKLKEKISVLETQQKEKIAELLKIRRFREGLERLRDEAKKRFIAEQDRLEQKELDEIATVSFTRNMMCRE
jgi:flagellar biosynthesis chaperone FliJ